MTRRLYRRLRLTFLGVVSIHSQVLVVIHVTVIHLRPSLTKKRYGYSICLENSNILDDKVIQQSINIATSRYNCNYIAIMINLEKKKQMMFILTARCV